MTDKATLELCRQTIRDQVRATQAMMRASHFNRDAKTEGHIAVIEARLRHMEQLVFAEIDRIEQRERGTDRETVLTKALVLAVADARVSRDQFKFYGASHRQKKTDDGYQKAFVNDEHAARTDATIEKIIEAVGPSLLEEGQDHG